MLDSSDAPMTPKDTAFAMAAAATAALAQQLGVPETRAQAMLFAELLSALNTLDPAQVSNLIATTRGLQWIEPGARDAHSRTEELLIAQDAAVEQLERRYRDKILAEAMFRSMDLN